MKVGTAHYVRAISEHMRDYTSPTTMVTRERASGNETSVDYRVSSLPVSSHHPNYYRKQGTRGTITDPSCLYSTRY